jgi:hypothetical protein
VLLVLLVPESKSLKKKLTFAGAPGAVLAVDVLSDAVPPAVLGGRVVALPSPELETVGAARRPRRPRGPLSVDGRTNLVEMLKNVIFFVADAPD